MLGFIFNVKAQLLLKNKLTVDLNYGYAKGIGNSETIENSIILPSLMNNMEKASAFSVSGKYVFNNTIGVSLSTGYVSFNNWQSPDNSNLYESSKLKLLSFKPGILITTPFQESGLLNRLTFDMVAGPAVGSSVIDIGRSTKWEKNPDEWVVDDLVTNTNNYGVFLDFSARFAITQQVDFHLNYGLSNYWGTSALVSDKRFLMQYFGAGIGFRMLVDKYYLYE